MVRGDHLLDAVWARDWNTLWNSLKRLMIPLYLQTRGIAVGGFFASLFLLFMPFPFLAYSAIFFDTTNSFLWLLAASIIASFLIYFAVIVVTTRGLHLKLSDALLAPVGSLIVLCGFLSGILQANSKSAVSWRGRNYSMMEYTQNSFSI